MKASGRHEEEGDIREARCCLTLPPVGHTQNCHLFTLNIKIIFTFHFFLLF